MYVHKKLLDNLVPVTGSSDFLWTIKSLSCRPRLNIMIIFDIGRQISEHHYTV